MTLTHAELVDGPTMASRGRETCLRERRPTRRSTIAAPAIDDLESRVRLHLAAGEPNAAATVVIGALGRGVRARLRSMLPDDDAHDAYSYFTEDVWRGLPGFLWKCPLRAWVYRVAWHAAVRLMRDAYRRRREPLEAASGMAAPVHAASDTWPYREQFEHLRDELHPQERNLLALRIGRELEWREVSAAMAAAGEKISSAALRKRFERLKSRLVALAEAKGLFRERRCWPAGVGAPDVRGHTRRDARLSAG